MTAVVRGDNQQPGADSETKEPDEWVGEANSVQIKSCPVSDHGSHSLLRAKKSLQSLANGDLRYGNNFLWRLKLSFRWRLKRVNEKAAEPPRLNRRRLRLFWRSSLLHCFVQRGGVQPVCASKVIETLCYAPGVFARLPVSLRVGKLAGDSSRLLVRFLKVVQDGFQVGWDLY